LGIRKSFAPLTMTAAQVSVTELNQESGVVGHKLYTDICLSCGMFNDLLTRKVNAVRQD